MRSPRAGTTRPSSQSRKACVRSWAARLPQRSSSGTSKGGTGRCSRPQSAQAFCRHPSWRAIRNHRVYLRGSRYVPPAPEAVLDGMEALFSRLRAEEESIVRAVLGHFLFVYIHPYPDGNGRIGRFLMNALLASGGLSLDGRSALPAARISGRVGDCFDAARHPRARGLHPSGNAGTINSFVSSVSQRHNGYFPDKLLQDGENCKLCLCKVAEMSIFSF